MPKILSTDTKKTWIPKCISIVMKEGGHTKEQAAGKCFGMWKQHMKNKKAKGELTKEEEIELQQIEKEEKEQEDKVGELLNKI